MMATISTRRRRSRASCLFESLEARSLLSAAAMHVAEAAMEHASANAAFHSPDHGSPTPIANLTGNALTFNQVVGVPVGREGDLPAVQDIATITSTTIPPRLNGYSVSIDWGDGSAATRGRLFVDKAGLIHVKGVHAYQTTGSFAVTITVTQNRPRPAAGATAPTLTIVSTANVTQNSATGVTITPTTGAAFSGAVGTFTIPTTVTNTDPASFTAFINWGDKSHSMGTVTLNSDGSYTVSGDHTYAAAGDYRISIFVVQKPAASTATAAVKSTTEVEFEHSCHASFIAAIFSTATVTDAPVV